jgi:23S rRNA pseudouridine2605 synthase
MARARRRGGAAVVATERLNRYLARSGVASRRAADALIASGQVRVNGRRPPPEGRLIDPEKDTVTVAGRRVEPAIGYRYLVLNKPPGVMVTASDPGGRPTVFDVLGEEALAGHRLFPVGRLDYDTGGLLLLTDDGDLAFRLTHPRHGVPKEYVAAVTGVPGEGDLRHLRAGIELEDGVTAPAEADLLRTRAGLTEVRLVIKEGRKRQVRRMLKAVGHPVRSLTRTAFGGVRLGRLRTGGWRLLSAPEIAALRRSVGLTA